MRRSDGEEMSKRGTIKECVTKERIKQSRLIIRLSCGSCWWLNGHIKKKRNHKTNQKSWKEEEFSLLKRIYFVKYYNFNSVKLIFPSTPHMVFIWAVIYPHEKTGRQMSFKVPNNSLESSVTIRGTRVSTGKRKSCTNIDWQAGAHPSCLWEGGGVHPGWLICLNAKQRVIAHYNIYSARWKWVTLTCTLYMCAFSSQYLFPVAVL